MSMKINYIILVICLEIVNVFKLYSQTKISDSGYPIVHLFTNYSMNFNQDKKAGFAFTRAYVGYHYNITDNLSARAIVDAAIPNSNSTKNDVFLKNAFITWNSNNKKFLIDGGLLCLRQFIHVQENWWGGRYINNTVTDRTGMFNGADYGFDVQYMPNSLFSFDFTFSNGEGFKSINIDNSFKYDLGITFSPSSRFVMRAVGELYSKSDELISESYIGDVKNQFISTLFMGYKYNKTRMGVETAYLWNKGFIDGRNTACFSVYANSNLYKCINVLARYDKVKSYQKEDDMKNWNVTDGDLFIVGLEYIINKKLRLSPNYRWSNTLSGNVSSLFVNLEFKL